MKYVELMELIEEKPHSANPLQRTATWLFEHLQDQYAFVVNLVELMEENGLLISNDHADEDGEVQRIDYLFLKNYEGFEIRVHWDFKVELKEFGY